jgi:FMN phosphatase YigB (HAD superfamily)
VLHVGDTLSDDVEGGLGVGMQVALVRRDSDLALPDVTILHSLDGVLPMVTPVGR